MLLIFLLALLVIIICYCKKNNFDYFQNEKVAFLHIPKTGGTSIQKFLKKYDIDVLSHKKLESGDQYPIIFTVMRDPISRFESAFWHHMTLDSDDHYYKKWDAWSTMRQDFSDPNNFIYSLTNPTDAKHLKAKKYFEYAHFRPQHTYIPNSIPENLIILRQENLDQEFKLLCNELGFNGTLKYENKTPDHSDIKLNENSIDFIKKTYEKDYKILEKNEINKFLVKETNWVSLNSNAWNGIDSVYVVALPTRLEYIRNILKKLNIKANILNAFDKKNINGIPSGIPSGIPDGIINPDVPKNQLYSGRIACHLSHSQILIHFLDSDKQTALILEDDIKILENSDQKIKDLVEKIDKIDTKWGIIYLGYCLESKNRDNKNDIIKLNRPLCTHAYIVNRKSAKILLDNFFPMYRSEGDQIMGELIASGKLTAYGPKKMILGQNENIGSIIGNSKGIGNVQFY